MMWPQFANELYKVSYLTPSGQEVLVWKQCARKSNDSFENHIQNFLKQFYIIEGIPRFQVCCPSAEHYNCIWPNLSFAADRDTVEIQIFLV